MEIYIACIGMLFFDCYRLHLFILLMGGKMSLQHRVLLAPRSTDLSRQEKAEERSKYCQF